MKTSKNFSQTRKKSEPEESLFKITVQQKKYNNFDATEPILEGRPSPY